MSKSAMYPSNRFLNKNVVILGSSLGGTDGQSLQGAHLGKAFKDIGASGVMYAAEETNDSLHVLPLLGLTHPEMPDNTRVNLKNILTQADVVTAENLLTTPSSPNAGGQMQLAEILADQADQGKLVIVRHHDEAWENPEYLANNRFPLRVHPDVVHVASSKHVAIKVSERINYPVHFWPNTLDEEFFEPAIHKTRRSLRGKLNLPESTFVVTFPGDPSLGRKNFPAALEVFHEINEMQPAVLWVTDTTKFSEKDYEKYAQLSTESLWGYRPPQPFAVFQISDIVLLPSHIEGWGTPVVEACATRTPVLWGEFPAKWELENMGAVGVDWRDSQRAQKLIDLMNNPIALANNQTISQNFHPIKLCKAILNSFIA